MAFSEAHAQGFALAAILQDDRDLKWAVAHVEGDLLQRAMVHVAEVRGDSVMREALARLVRAVHGEHDPSLLPSSLATRFNAKSKTPDANDELSGVLSRLARREMTR